MVISLPLTIFVGAGPLAKRKNLPELVADINLS
jgi:hypothetical protein